MSKVTFTVGEIITAKNRQTQFRVRSVGTQGIRIELMPGQKKVQPKEPFLVEFKGVVFRVAGWDKKREFSLIQT